MTNNLNNKYTKLIKIVHEYDKEEYYELAHINTEKIYRNFINDISNKKLNKIEDIVEIAKDIKKHIILYEKDKKRWYA